MPVPQPIAVVTGSLDRAGMPAMADGMLVTVLVRWGGPVHSLAGDWFLEAGLARLRELRPPAFEILQAATRRIRQCIEP